MAGRRVRRVGRASSCSRSGWASTRRTFVGQAPIAKPVTSRRSSTVLSVAGRDAARPRRRRGAWASLVLRLRRSHGLRRRQVVVLLVAAGVLLVVSRSRRDCSPRPVDVLAQAAAVALVPVAIGVAVTRHRLYDLDTAVCRPLVTASLAVCLIGVYLSVFAVLSALLRDGSVFGAAVAAGATGALVQPLGRRLSAGVDRLFYGDRADPYAVPVPAVTGDLTAVAGLDVDGCLAWSSRAVVESLRLPGAPRWCSRSTGRPAIGWPERVDVRPVRRRSSCGTAGDRRGLASRAAASRRGRLVTERDAEILALVADLVAPVDRRPAAAPGAAAQPGAARDRP